MPASTPGVLEPPSSTCWFASREDPEQWTIILVILSLNNLKYCDCGFIVSSVAIRETETTTFEDPIYY